MKSLITGAGGFIGRYLVAHLLEDRKQESVTTIGLHAPEDKRIAHYPCDLSKPEETQRLVEKIAPDRVYHLAGSAKVSQSIGMAEYFQSNFLTTLSLLKALVELKAPVSVFFASSVHVYGNQRVEVNESSPVQPTGFYGFSKYLAEEALRHYAHDFDRLNVVVGRLNSCIGPGQPEGFVVADLCRKIAAFSDERPAVLKTGPLSGIRRFMDVRDTVRLFPLLLDARQPSRYEIYNIASPYELQIRQIVDSLVKLYGHPVTIESSEEGDNPFLGLKLSVAKLREVLPAHHFRPIEETLRDTLDWTRKHGPKA